MKCYVLIGPPACGKSTFRVELLSHYTDIGPVILSGDDLIEEECLALGLTYAQAFVKHDFKAQKKILRAKFQQAITDGRDIIIDRTNLTRKSRRSFLDSLPKYYEKIGVVFSTSEVDIFARLEKRGLDTGKIIPVDVVKEMIKSYQAPEMGEFHRIINV